jgi:hypothetical protein
MTSVKEGLLNRIIKKLDADPLPFKFLLSLPSFAVDNTQECKNIQAIQSTNIISIY